MNIKKLFPEKSITKKSIMEFLDKKGFYIVLVLCILIVGATAVFVTTRNITSSNTGSDAQKIIPEELESNYAANIVDKAGSQSASSIATGQNTEAKAVETPKPSPQATATKAPAAQPGNTTQNKPSNTKTAEVKSSDFILPVFGEVTLEYAQDKLAYSNTLEEWRTHSGLDLAADRGTSVKAVADGVVSDVKNDPGLGITVIIDHQNGIKTVYANLASDEMVVTNQKVKQGDVIGSVGNTAMFESAEQSHLHFEVLKNGAPVDPSTYLPKK